MDVLNCINNEQWLLYAEHKLPTPQRLQIEQHVLHCEICADIKSGIDAMAQPQTLKTRVASINQKADEKLLPKRWLIQPMYWAAAALVVSLCVALYVNYTNTNQPAIASVKQAPAEEEMNQPKTDTAADDFIVLNQPKPEPKKVKAKRVPENSPVTKTLDDYAGVVVEQPTQTKAENNDMAASAGVAEEEKVPVKTLSAPEVAQEQIQLISTTKQKKRLSQSKPSAKYPSAEVANNNNNSRVEIESNSNTMATDSIMVLKANTYLILQQPDSCLWSLSNLMERTNHPLFAQAVLLGAQAHVAKGEKRKAKQLLNQISNRNDVFGEEARSLLQTLNK